MIDRDSGCLRWERPSKGVLSPQLTRSDFLASGVWPGRQLQRDAKPWSVWRVDELGIKQHRLAASVTFHGERLHSISLAIVDPSFGEGWAEWSRERELARKAAHDEILREDIGLQRSFVWGDVHSNYDPRSGGSSIVVEYATQPWKRRIPLLLGACSALGLLALGLHDQQMLFAAGVAALFVLVLRQAR